MQLQQQNQRIFRIRNFTKQSNRNEWCLHLGANDDDNNLQYTKPLRWMALGKMFTEDGYEDNDNIGKLICLRSSGPSILILTVTDDHFSVKNGEY